jgi:hypothetical protein
MSEVVEKIMAEALTSLDPCCATCKHFYLTPNGVMGYCRAAQALYPRPVDMFDGCPQWARASSRGNPR